MELTRKKVRILLLVLAAAGAAYFLWSVRRGLYPFILAFFWAYLLNPAVNWLQTKGVKRLWAIGILYVLVFGVLVACGSRLIPHLVRELENFARDLPLMTAKGEELIGAFQEHYQNPAVPLSLREAIDNGLVALQTELRSFIAAVVDGIIGLLTHSIGLAISPVLAFYLLHDWREISEAFTHLFPASWRREALLVARDVDKVLAGVIRGQLLIALIVGILVTVGLSLMHVRYALLIGILAGLLDIIPYFGAIIGATPAVTVALMESPWLATKVAVLFLVIHQAEGTIIGPKILSEKIGLHPLWVIFFLFIGEETGGLAGMLLGVPVAAVAKVFLAHLVRLLV